MSPDGAVTGTTAEPPDEGEKLPENTPISTLWEPLFPCISNLGASPVSPTRMCALTAPEAGLRLVTLAPLARPVHRGIRTGLDGAGRAGPLVRGPRSCSRSSVLRPRRPAPAPRRRAGRTRAWPARARRTLPRGGPGHRTTWPAPLVPVLFEPELPGAYVHLAVQGQCLAGRCLGPTVRGAERPGTSACRRLVHASWTRLAHPSCLRILSYCFNACSTWCSAFYRSSCRLSAGREPALPRYASANRTSPRACCGRTASRYSRSRALW